MGPLDFPPEIFQNVVAQYVSQAGVAEAWAGRKVCKTFYFYITHEILGRQAPEAFSRDCGAQRVLKENICEFIKYRMTALHGCPPLIPNFVRDMVDSLMQVSSKKISRDRCIDLVVGFLKKDYVYSHYLSSAIAPVEHYYNHVHNYLQNITALDEVAAAVLTGDIDIVRSLLDCRSVNVWIESQVFGRPLTLAVSKKSLPIMKAICKKAYITPVPSQKMYFTDEGYDSEGGRQASCCQAIDKALTYSNHDIALFLFQFYGKHFRIVSKHDLRLWLDRAIRTGNSGLVHAVLDIKHDEGPGAIAWLIDAFILACELNHWTIASIFFDRRFLHVDQKFGYHESPLTIAVKYGRYDLVLRLLDMGATADGPKQLIYKPHYEARKRGFAEIQQLLVDRGAQTHYTDSQADYSGKERLLIGPRKTDPVHREISEEELFQDAPSYFTIDRFPKISSPNDVGHIARWSQAGSFTLRLPSSSNTRLITADASNQCVGTPLFVRRLGRSPIDTCPSTIKPITFHPPSRRPRYRF